MTARTLQTSRYSPGNLAPDVLERLFVGRDELLKELLAKVLRSILTKDKHHMLLVGPRGAGKTHVMALLHQRLTTDPSLAEARAKAVIAYLNEEEWGVASFLDFILVILRSIQPDHSEVTARILLVEETFERDPEKAREIAEDTLLRVVKSKTLVLLCENLNDLFEGLGPEGQRRWRSLVQESRFWCIVASAPSLFLAISRQTEPFYGFFAIRNLEALSLEDAIELLRRKAELEGRLDLAAAIDTAIGRARVRAIHHIAGGNHRAYIVLSEFLTRESLDELITPFMNMVDDLTPYYQERMRNLISPLQRKLVDYMCRQRKPSTVKDIARATLVLPQSAAKQLGELAKAGIVQKTPRGRESFYELSEPLMRICIEVKDKRTEYIKTFVDLLRHWFSSREIELKYRDHGAQSSSLDYIHLRAALEDYQRNKTDPFLDALGLEASHCEKEGDLKGIVEAAGRRADELGQAQDYIQAIQASMSSEDYVTAEMRALEGVKRHPDDLILSGLLAILLYVQDKHEPALARCNELLERKPQWIVARTLRGEALFSLGRYEEVVDNEDVSLRIAPDHGSSYELRARALSKLGRQAEAEATLSEWRTRQPSSSAYLASAELMLDLKKNEEGLRYCDLALQYDLHSSQAWRYRGEFLERLGRLEEALENEHQLLAIDPGHIRAYRRIADVLVKLRRVDEAFGVSSGLIAKQPDDDINWLTHLYVALERGSYREADEALLQYKRLSSDVDNGFALLEVSLKGVLGRWRDAVWASEQILDRGATADAVFANAWASLGEGTGLSPQQEATLLACASTVSNIWLHKVLEILRLTDHDRVRADVVSRAGARADGHGGLLYERALALADQGKLDDVALAAEHLLSLGVDTRSKTLMLLVKVARLGMSSIVDELIRAAEVSGEPLVHEVLVAGLWIELQQRGPTSFAVQFVALRDGLSENSAGPLTDALWTILRRMLRTRSPAGRSSEWESALARMASPGSGLEASLQLFSVGVRYAATEDESVLLALPLEQRKLLTSELGRAS